MVKMFIHEFDSIEHAPFDVYDYSRMKFGSDRVAKNFGYEMADQYFGAYDCSPTVVIPAPSTTVPVAATLLSRHIVNRLNSRLASIGKKAVEWSMIHRDMACDQNYAYLSKEKRQKLLAADSIYINKDFIKGKAVVFVDDCTITGAQEERIADFMRKQGLPNRYDFVAYAKFVGRDPSVESRLNHMEIKDAADLVSLSWEQGYQVTARSLRLLLEYPGQYFETLLSAAPEKFIEESFYASLIEGYNVHPRYRPNFNILSAHLGIRNQRVAS